MEKTGLINKFLSASSRNWEAVTLLNDSKEHHALTASLSETLHILKEVAISKNIETMIAIEKFALILELENHGNSSEERNSIKTALQQLEDAQKSLVIVKDDTAYQASTETYSTKRKESGLPLDSFREFLKSHTTRLTNRLAAPLSAPEKNILRQRKENLQVARDLYIKMQRTALCLPSQSKIQGIE